MRLVAFVSATLLASTGLAAAQGYETPQALIEALYAPYLADELPGDEAEFRSETLQYFYDQDAANTPEGELGALDFDPFVDGQDFQLTDFEMDDPVEEDGYVVVDVRFNNIGEPRELSFELVEEEDGWKVDDVVSYNPDHAYRLSDILGDNPSWR